MLFYGTTFVVNLILELVIVSHFLGSGGCEAISGVRNLELAVTNWLGFGVWTIKMLIKVLLIFHIYIYLWWQILCYFCWFLSPFCWPRLLLKEHWLSRVFQSFHKLLLLTWATSKNTLVIKYRSLRRWRTRDGSFLEKKKEEKGKKIVNRPITKRMNHMADKQINEIICNSCLGFRPKKKKLFRVCGQLPQIWI